MDLGGQRPSSCALTHFAVVIVLEATGLGVLLGLVQSPGCVGLI